MQDMQESRPCLLSQPFSFADWISTQIIISDTKIIQFFFIQISKVKLDNLDNSIGFQKQFKQFLFFNYL